MDTAGDDGSVLEVLSHDVAKAASPLLWPDTVKLMFCGGISGALSKTCTAPLARLTIMYQVQALQRSGGAASSSGIGSSTAIAGAASSSSSSVGLFDAFRQVVRREGVLSLWKGNTVTIIHRLPYSAVNFATYEFTNQRLKQHVDNEVVRRLLAGAASGLVACTAAYPLDLLRTRLAASTSGKYSQGVVNALRQIAHEEGLRGLYKGLNATLLQVVPGLALNFCFYDTLKHKLTPPGEQPSSRTSLLCACTAGFGAATLTYPMDVVRRRMQVFGQGSATATPSYLATCWAIWSREGARAFYAGIVPEYCKVIPGMAIAFVTYEALKGLTGVSKEAGGSK